LGNNIVDKITLCLVGLFVQHTFQSLLFVMSVFVRKQKRLMACLTLLFIVILTKVSKVTSLHCSNQQLPASGDDDLQQVTTLHYCQVDNCTIRRLDTGEKLDIVYTTDSVIVTTPIDDHTTSALIATKDEPVFPCEGYQVKGVALAFVMTNPSVVMVVSMLIVTITLLFKELHSLFGYLLMLYNVAMVCYCILILVTLSMEYLVAVNSHAICYIVSVASSLSGLGAELFGTCILHSFAYIVYCSEKLRTIEPEDRKRWAKYYAIYCVTIVMFVLLCIVGYDITRNNINGIILPNGRCIYIGRHVHDTLQILFTTITINKIIQLVLFITYLYYTYQLNKDISNPAILERQQSLLHKIGLAMGAVVGLSYIIFAIASTVQAGLLAFAFLSSLLTTAQQFTIIGIFLCSKKMRRKYKKCLSKD